MLFRQLIDNETSTFTYLLADEGTREAVLIDCVYEQHFRDLALLRELDLRLTYTLETHVHADHVTGAWLMKQALGSAIGVSATAGAQGLDLAYAHGDVITIGQLRLEVLETPGHTAGCVSFVVPAEKLVFTGDALLIRGAGRTDFQQGDAERLFRSVRERILSLPLDYVVYPAHDYDGRCSSTIAEERRFNPRLGDGVREEDFVGYMKNLGLPHPKKLNIAVPANLVCGKPSDGSAGPRLPDWGPVVRTYAGVLQVEPEWVHTHAEELTIVDVRELDEIKATEMGLLPKSVIAPLSTLRQHLDELPRDRPIIVVCPAGARSAIAATLLEKAGVPRVANLRGGILGWRAHGQATESPSTVLRDAFVVGGA
ncbi:MAG TPA: MBL fold metallo-hydrolase [Polyangiaceae bacterium]|nr:MBL fold metallo-hydrolase [Polyangiaceae bacterium]